MIPEYFQLNETMPLNPRLQGTLEVDELCRALRTLLILPNTSRLIEERFAHVPPPFDPACLSFIQKQPLAAAVADAPPSSAASNPDGPPGTVIDEDRDRRLRDKKIEEARLRVLEGAEAALRQPGDLPETPGEHQIDARTVDWVRSFYENLPEEPEDQNVTQSTTSPVRLSQCHGYDAEDYEESLDQDSEESVSVDSRPQIQYMSHNRRWFVGRMPPVVPSVERDRSDRMECSEDREIKEEDEDEFDWDEDLYGEEMDEGDDSMEDIQEPRLGRPSTRTGDIVRHSTAPSPPAAPQNTIQEAQLRPASQPVRRRGRPPQKAKTAATNKSNKKNNNKTANSKKPAPRGRKRQRSNSDSINSRPKTRSTKRQQPLRRSSRLAVAG